MLGHEVEAWELSSAPLTGPFGDRLPWRSLRYCGNRLQVHLPDSRGDEAENYLVCAATSEASRSGAHRGRAVPSRSIALDFPKPRFLSRTWSRRCAHTPLRGGSAQAKEVRPRRSAMEVERHDLLSPNPTWGQRSTVPTVANTVRLLGSRWATF
jgi:hypothetical protein